MLSLQDLLDHTTARILMIDFVYKNGLNNLVLYSKWGCDGSSGQREYKQKLPEESKLVSDSNLFIASCVPIRLIDETTKEEEGTGVQVKHELFLTMIDGEVAQVLTDTRSNSTCTICGTTPRLMNNLSNVTAGPENENY
ncbi:hypothetical protein ILUMI_17192 [Ignelater luminosus]|uniref:Uncharacterized protein n=1 Tax=Ignelater luminosus TaxID=2038154 RepID=A0A8K0CNS8_IGNLU|nr:hypothetical protein ILUMI_17192 [Ignelater luminosus]